MIKETVTLDEAVDYLNSLLAADPLAMRALLCTFIPANEALANHPTAVMASEWPEGYTIGFLGAFNGLFGFDEEKSRAGIAYAMDQTRGIIKFIRADDPSLKLGDDDDI